MVEAEQVAAQAPAGEWTRERIRQWLAEALQEMTGVPPELVVEGEPLRGSQIDLDSLTFAELEVMVERQFGFQVPDGQIRGSWTVTDVVDYIVEQVEVQVRG